MIECSHCGYVFDPVRSRWLCPQCHNKETCCEGEPLSCSYPPPAFAGLFSDDPDLSEHVKELRGTVMAADYMSQQWYPNKDDLIGGWMVANVDLPSSRIDPKQGHWQIIECISEEAARHICELHNTQLPSLNNG